MSYWYIFSLAGALGGELTGGVQIPIIMRSVLLIIGIVLIGLGIMFIKLID